MAKILAMMLVCFLLSSLRLSEGKPVPPRQSFAKIGTRLPSQQFDGDTEKPEEPTTSLDDCSQFCSQSYPQHTYPNPSHHKACVTGCHSAKVDALIAWPFSSSNELCTSACNEAYPSSSEQQYACTTGCNATTIDSLFPDRGVIYGEVSLNDSSVSDSAPLEQAADLMSYFLNNFFNSFSFDLGMEKLTDHASQMRRLLPPVRNSMITYVIDDGDVMEVQEYSFQGGLMIEDPTDTIFDFVEFPVVNSDIVEMNSVADSQSSDGKDDSVSGSLDSVYVYFSPSPRERCKWFVRRMVASRVLMGLAIVFIGLAVLMCCLGVIKSDTNRAVNGRKKMTAFVQSHTPSTVKVPLDGSSKFRPDHSHLMLPVHIKVGGDKTVEGVITVVK